MLFPAIAIHSARIAEPRNLAWLFFTFPFSSALISHAWSRLGSELHRRVPREGNPYRDKYQSRKSPHYITRLMDTFHTTQGARKGASTSIDQISTVHMCTHVFVNGPVLTMRRQFKANSVGTNNELLCRPENAASPLPRVFFGSPGITNNAHYLFRYWYNDVNFTGAIKSHVSSPKRAAEPHRSIFNVTRINSAGTKMHIHFSLRVTLNCRHQNMKNHGYWCNKYSIIS